MENMRALPSQLQAQRAFREVYDTPDEQCAARKMVLAYHNDCLMAHSSRGGAGSRNFGFRCTVNRKQVVSCVASGMGRICKDD